MPNSGDDIKRRASGLEPPRFDDTAFTTPPPLAEATVAILTSASLHHPEQPDFGPADTSFRVLDPNRRDYVLGHWSQDVDQTGYGIDPNVVFPIDRLEEMAADGRIGKVADVHLAYAGNQFDVAGIRLDSGPEGARLLREAGVDVVLLTPV
jgi:D-proline reductase (dithiol) PrdB